MSPAPGKPADVVALYGLLAALCLVVGVLFVRFPDWMARRKSFVDPPETTAGGDQFRQLFGVFLVGTGVVLAVMVGQTVVAIPAPVLAASGAVLLGAGVVLKDDVEGSRGKLAVVLSLVTGAALVMSSAFYL